MLSAALVTRTQVCVAVMAASTRATTAALKSAAVETDALTVAHAEIGAAIMQFQEVQWILLHSAGLLRRSRIIVL